MSAPFIPPRIMRRIDSGDSLMRPPAKRRVALGAMKRNSATVRIISSSDNSGVSSSLVPFMGLRMLIGMDTAPHFGPLRQVQGAGASIRPCLLCLRSTHQVLFHVQELLSSVCRLGCGWSKARGSSLPRFPDCSDNALPASLSCISSSRLSNPMDAHKYSPVDSPNLR